MKIQSAQEGNLTRLYVAGPMSGIPEFNHPAFNRARDLLTGVGYSVCNPADLDPTLPYDELIAIGLQDLEQCGGVALLDGWERSAGALGEVKRATEMRLVVEPVWFWLAKAANEAAIRRGLDVPLNMT